MRYLSWWAFISSSCVVACVGRPSSQSSTPAAATPGQASVQADSALVANASAPAGERPRGAYLLGVSPISERVAMLTFEDGKVTKWPTLGNGSDGAVEYSLMDVAKVRDTSSFAITSPDDLDYAKPVSPEHVGRKSKGKDFVNVGGTVAWVMQHQVYVVLPKPLKSGKTYTFDVGTLANGEHAVTLKFDERSTRSETIHVNQVGYLPDAPKKYAYLSHWAGDLGPIALDDYAKRTFWVLDAASGKEVLSGSPRLRKSLTQGSPDTGRDDEPKNYVGADLWELDFSQLKKPGKYVLAVEGLGTSFPFPVARDAYRKPFVTIARGVFHQRDGVEIEAKHSAWPRPACHHPDKSKTVFKQTTARYMDDKHSDGWPQADSHLTGEERRIWGGYQDAGDWDREGGHINVPSFLLLAYELAPANFRDGELDIPESGNGLPDIVDEALWGLDFWRRIQRPEGGVSVGTFASSWPKNGETCWTDTLKWYVYADEPAMSYRYAAVALQAGHVLRGLGKADLADTYVQSGERAYAWAQKNQKPEDESKVRDDRQRAAAWLFKVLGSKKYEEQFKKDLQIIGADTPLSVWAKHDQRFAVWAYVTTARSDMDLALKQKLRDASLNWADTEFVASAERRGLRNGYHLQIPMFWGSGAHPRVSALMMAHYLSKNPKYLEAYLTSLDFTFGTNPLNMTWVTGLGARYPKNVMNINTWYTATREPIHGLLPFGPYRYDGDNAPGPWDPKFAQVKTAYPHPKYWPPLELWFEVRQTPATNEYVVETSAETAAVLGYLAGPAASP